MIKTIKQLEKGMFVDARAKGMTFNEFLEDMAMADQISPDLVRVRAEAPKTSMGKPLSPTRQLMLAAGMRMSSKGGIFFTDPANTVLFPAFLSDVYWSFEKVPPALLQITDLVSVRTPVNSRDYTANAIAAGQEADLEPGMVEEGAEAEWYIVKDQTRSIRLRKHLRGLKMSYEAVQMASLNILEKRIEKLALAMNRVKVKRALEVIINGDGNSNPAANTSTGASTWAFGDLVDLYTDCIIKGAMPTLLVGEAVDYAAWLKLAQFTNADTTASGGSLRDTGAIPRPMGMAPKAAPAGSILAGSKKGIAYDQSIGIEEAYFSGLNLVEEDKLIDKQFTRIVFSEMFGYAKHDIDVATTRTRT